MLSAKLITPKKVNVLGSVLAGRMIHRFAICFFLFGFVVAVQAQDNSPYSRYGMGDLVPSTNIINRGMGSFSAGYHDMFSVNFNNPASYAFFQSFKEQKSKQLQAGRAILDIGINLENRALREPNNIEKFNASNAIFSHVQLGVPLSPKWGLSFGLRPVSRISYKIGRSSLLTDPNTGQPIDSAFTLNQGDGGAYLASMGVGHRINISANHTLALGINGGYFFGKKDYSNRLNIFNDSLLYNAGNFQTITSYGDLYFNAGLQYVVRLKSNMLLTLGAYGNWKQSIKATQDITRETYTYSESAGYLQLDSVSVQKDRKGEIVYPSSYTYGFVLEQIGGVNKPSWMVGMDFLQSKWSDYRFYGEADPTVKDRWELRLGGQIRPISKRNYFSNVAYRAGFFTGPDYIYIGKKLPVTGVSLGLGLPIANYSRMTSPDQVTFLNLAFEFIKRGNNDSQLKENLFRLSAGFSLTDLWFRKRKYE